MRSVFMVGLLCAALVSGATVQAPVTGYVSDTRTGALRPIDGLPGSSLLGAPLALPFVIDQVQVCSNSFALASESRPLRHGAKQFKALWLIGGLRAGNVTASRLATPFADHIALNASCSGGLLYSESSNSITFVTGLPNQAQLSEPISLAQLAGRMTAMTLSSDASKAVVGMADTSGGGIYVITPGSSAPEFIANAVRPTSVELLNNDKDLAIADAATPEVLTIENFEASKVFRSVLSAKDGLQKPVAIRVVNQYLFAADAGSNMLVQFDLSTGTMVKKTPLSVAPTRIYALALSGVYALTDAGQTPLLLLDVSQGSSVFFVPLDQDQR